MIGNVQILKNNGESLISNGLAHFKFNATNKQYVIYTLGEQINELLKIYVGYENAPVTDPGMTEEESTTITELLKKIGKNEDVSSIITIIPLSAGLYRIHDKVKKVALQTSAFNNIINIQQKGQIQNLSQDEPIMKENTFFDASVTNAENVQKEVIQEQSIFDNPMKPVIETPSGQAEDDNVKTEKIQPSMVGKPAIETASEVLGTGEIATNSNQIQEKMSELNSISNTSSISGVSGISNTSSTYGEETSEMIDNSASILENETMISDEEAKNAILAVEEAQATIKNNIVIIKEFIKQQKNKVVTEDAETIEEVKTENKNANELSAMSSQVETLSSQYDVVNNLELAPQPEISENVLGSESELDNSYIDTSVNQVSSDVSTGSLVDTSVTMPSTPTPTPQPEPEISVVQQASKGLSSQVPLNEQKLPAETSLPNEQQPEMIDTMAMIPKQGVINETANVSTIPSFDDSNSEVLDTTNMVAAGNFTGASQVTEASFDNSTSQAMNDTLINSENQESFVSVSNAANNQDGLSSQSMQNDTIDIQIPEVELESSFVNSDSGQFVQEPIPASSAAMNNTNMTGSMTGNMQQQYSGEIVNGEFAIPQIDMNVSTLEGAQAPVVMPDGQSQDVNQGLVLTPEAFNKAA